MTLDLNLFMYILTLTSDLWYVGSVEHIHPKTACVSFIIIDATLWCKRQQYCKNNDNHTKTVTYHSEVMYKLELNIKFQTVRSPHSVCRKVFYKSFG